MSPSLWFGRDQLFTFIDSSPLPKGRMYLDVGTAEGPSALGDARALRSRLEPRLARGAGSFLYLEDRGGKHEEAAWSRRLEGALRFLLDQRAG